MNHTLTLNKVEIGQSYAVGPLQPINDALQRIFSSPQEETKLQRTRRIMGSVVTKVSDEDLEVYITELQYLVDTWFDEFERNAFDGLTLKQLIHE